MAVKKEATIHRYIGLAADTKPTGVPIGSTFLVYDSKALWVTHDGTNWVEKERGIYTTPAHTQPSIGATTTAALAANANRLYALFINDSNETIYLKLGAAAVLNQGIRLNASGGSYEISKLLGNLYTGAVNGICTSGSKVLLVTEGT